MAKRVKPGEKPPRSGEYKPVGPRGGRVDAPSVTIDGNEGHMPPTPDNGQKWERTGPQPAGDLNVMPLHNGDLSPM